MSKYDVTVIGSGPGGYVAAIRCAQLGMKTAIIANRSKPASLPGIEIDKKRIITSTEALTLKEIPKEVIVIGGGIIGCEMASVFARVGTKVKIIEYHDSLIANMDKELGKEL